MRALLRLTSTRAVTFLAGAPRPGSRSIGARHRWSAAFIVAGALLAWPSAAPSAQIELSGDSRVVIREEGPFDSAAGLLGDLLKRHLLLALGKTELAGPGPEVTFVLRAKARDWYELPRRELKDISDVDAFEVVISASPRPTVTITGQTPLAAGYGVVFFLEKHLGILWAFPGELGLCLPVEQSFRLQEGTERVSPWILSRVMSGLELRDRQRDLGQTRPMTGVLRDHRAFFLADDFFKSLRLHPGSVTHNMIHVFPVEECRARCPEIFPLKADGTRFIPEVVGRDRAGRKGDHAWHPCYTHPKTLEVAVAKGTQAFEEGRLFFSLGINDGRLVQCQCDRCRQVGWPHSYYRFVGQVAEALREYYPPQRIGVLAYGDVGIPPNDLKLPENVLVNVAGMRKALWESLAPSFGTYEYIYGAGYVIPNLPLDVIQENMRYYQAHHLRMYRAEFYPVWAFDAPKAYIVSRLLWDPNQDVYRLLRVFCRRAFGDAEAPMVRYYEHVASIRRSDVQPGRFTPVWDRQWPFGEPLQFDRCPEDLHRRLFACLDEAKSKELTARQRERLAMIEAFTEFSELYYGMHVLKEDVFSGRADPTIAITRAAELNERKRQVLTTLAEHPEWFAGSSVKADGLHERPWPTGRLEQELEAAVATAALRLAEGQGLVPEGRGPAPEEMGRYGRPKEREPCRLLPLMREEHSWYKPTQFVRMDIVSRQRGGGFTFQAAPHVIIQEEEDPRRHGKLKAQWLHGLARDLPLRDDLLYAVTANLDGRHGMLQLRAQGTLQLQAEGRLRTEARRQIVFAHSMLAFGQKRQEATRQIVIDPTRYLEQLERPGNGAAPPTTFNVQLYLVWRPEDESSELHGRVELERITMEAP